MRQPLPGADQALVIAGSDKRAAIYGVYDLAEQIGVWPWYRWADVPVAGKAAISVKPGRFLQSEPAAKYRGIFLNDEAPALSGWSRERFGGWSSKFYILRLKGNYLWPAMWDAAFNEDDPLNPVLEETANVAGDRRGPHRRYTHAAGERVSLRLHGRRHKLAELLPRERSQGYEWEASEQLLSCGVTQRHGGRRTLEGTAPAGRVHNTNGM